MDEQVERIIRSAEIPRPDFVFHYTTPPALLGIGTHQVLFAGIAEEMNDLREQTIASERCSERLRNRVEASEFADVWDQIRGVIRVHGRDLRNITQERTSLFTVSFSGARDSLEQWRAYAATPGSMAIGFKLSHLAQAGEAQDFWLAPCIYDEATHLQESQLLADAFLERLDGPEQMDLNLLAREFQTRVQMLDALFKDPSFSSEQEWRLVSHNSRRQKNHVFLATSSGLREFRPFEIFTGVNPNATHIYSYFGPNGDHRQMLQTWESLRHEWVRGTDSWGYSKVPFRAQ